MNNEVESHFQGTNNHERVHRVLGSPNITSATPSNFNYFFVDCPSNLQRFGTRLKLQPFSDLAYLATSIGFHFVEIF